MLSCIAVQKWLAVCLLHQEINNEQKGKQLERSSGLAGGKSTTEHIAEAVHTPNSYDNMCTYDAQEYYFLLK